jgi:hypothetical protein
MPCLPAEMKVCLARTEAPVDPKQLPQKLAGYVWPRSIDAVRWAAFLTVQRLQRFSDSASHCRYRPAHARRGHRHLAARFINVERCIHRANACEF